MLKKLSPDSMLDQNSSSYPSLEFHLRNALAEVMDLKLPLFALESGKFKIDYHALQNLVQVLNEIDPDPQLKASELNGMGLLTLISHKILRLYRNQVNPKYIHDLTEYLEQEFGSSDFEEVLSNYLTVLPTNSLKTISGGVEDYLEGHSQSVPNIHIVVEELLVHILALNNPAFDKYNMIFKEAFHERIKDPDKLLKAIENWSKTNIGFGAGKKSIMGILLEPMLAAPESISGQLTYIQSNWSNYLGSHLGDLLRGLDFFKEENRFRGFGPGETQIPVYRGDLLEGEYYSEDSDWMPSVVMIARNTLVWLDQLSKKYQREIKTLSDIPDQELNLLAQQGFTVLWLIGLWNRSGISKKIKHWCGNPDAESSAYSLKEYQIDSAIGGPGALDNLRHRAWERGIRLASDMVPNHTGLDSDWLKEHPEWYITAADSPFPAYKFDGGDLSTDPEISIHLEDHYYDRSDAAVVFKHYDHRNGQSRYVYHGNDGTSMPWNDTAQLNYLNPELREAIIQTILEVARQFKVIRFDAAMTLAKKHIQRLWYPEPGSGGDIPSRSAFSMSGAEFNAAIPAEFWREVVDRVAVEVPDTLLLAEAFWMMEGYFVRTLGMHRVYNSAFMNMLKMEENSKFFGMIAKTLEFDPRILQRFVNFLSNPDEDTAIAQFGKGDKYFGATVLMVTLPGLPMFAHAQVEGFEEKYGMEYRRAYWEETPDEELITRHKQQIFPLMKKRHLFAGASNFRLFPMLNSDGNRVESVFAYSNRKGDERSLVLVNNSYSSQSGWIKTAMPINVEPAADHSRLETDDLISALSFTEDNNSYVIFQDQISNLWYIRSISEISQQGLYMELAGYESQVYLNFQLVNDTESDQWSSIFNKLNGKGVNDFAPLFRSIELEPVQHLFVNFLKLIVHDELPSQDHIFIKFAPLFEAMLELDDISLLIEETRKYSDKFTKDLSELIRNLKIRKIKISEDLLQVAVIFYLARQLSDANAGHENNMMQLYELQECIDTLNKGDLNENIPGLLPVLEYADRLKALLTLDIQDFFTDLFTHGEVTDYFLINEVEGSHWFNQERMEIFLKYFEILFMGALTDDKISTISQAIQRSEYQLNKFLDQFKL